MNVQTISPKDLLVYLCLRRYRNKHTGKASVPITQLVNQTGAAPVTVLNCLSRLAKMGHIEYAKQGRTNVYSFCTNIEAKTYDFLDRDIPCDEKIKLALENIIPGKQTNSGGNRLDGYVLDLEKQIISLNEHVRMLTDEVNKTKKLLSVITGQPYHALPELGSETETNTE